MALLSALDRRHTVAPSTYNRWLIPPAALAVHLVKKDAPPMALTIMASAGSFAAVSTPLGSPILGAFLIMEAAGIGGASLSMVALPGLLASGIGALIFVGLDSYTGLGDFSR